MSLAGAGRLSVDRDARVKVRDFLCIERARHRVERQGALVLLAPLDQPALEVGLLLGHIDQIDISIQQMVYYQSVGEIVPLVQIERSDHGFERVAVEVFLLGTVVALRDTVPVGPDTDGQLVQRRSADDARPQLRQKALVLLGKLDEQIVRDDRLEHGVAQKFEPLVVDRRAVVQKKRS